MEKKDGLEKIFNYSLGCIGLVAVLVTVITLFVTLRSPSVVIQLIEKISDLSTSTPIVVQVTREVQVPLETTVPNPPGPSSPSTVSLPFEDTFDLRAKPEWQSAGTWRVVDGHYTSEANKPLNTFVGDENWRNYRVNVISYSSYFYNFVQIIVRANKDGYLAFRVTYSKVQWILFNNDGETVIAQKEVIQSQGYNRATYKIAVDVNNDIFTGYVNDAQALQIQDNTFPNGRVGLGFDRSDVVWFDDFSVTPND